MFPLEFSTINSSHPLYPKLCMLRDEVLRKPLGLALSPQDTSNDFEDLIFVATDSEQQIVACVMAKPLADASFKLRQMAVKQAYQGKGLGKKLMMFAEDILHETGAKKIILNAREEAVPFYQKLGYQGTGAVFLEVTIPHIKMEKCFEG